MAANGSDGFIVGENDSLVDAHERVLRYSQWMDFEITPLLSVEDALGVAMKVYG